MSTVIPLTGGLDPPSSLISTPWLFRRRYGYKTKEMEKSEGRRWGCGPGKNGTESLE